MAQEGEVNQIINSETGEGNNQREALRRYYTTLNDNAYALRNFIIRQRIVNGADLNNQADNLFRRVLKYFNQVTDEYIESQGNRCICDNPSLECEGYCDPMRTLNRTFVD